MENNASLVATLFERTERYAKTSAELYKLKAIDKTADIVSTLAARLAVTVFILLFFLILNIAVALLIGESLGKSYYGFFTVAAFYALAAILLYIFRIKWIKAPLRNSIITQSLK